MGQRGMLQETWSRLLHWLQGFCMSPSEWLSWLAPRCSGSSLAGGEAATSH